MNRLRVRRPAHAVDGTDHGVRDLGPPVSAIERPRTDVFGAVPYPTLHEKAAALLRSVARDHALIAGDERTAWLTTRVRPAPAGVPWRALARPAPLA
ncbi:hypothetical protein [Streptomyces sp. NBC_00247]|uniref:hypothetical protein n=1 Tax=Streptomyces sp. NBC_00247 TaxID=2975689 RepID=UPI003FA74B9D